jgi:hypothetical protein
VPWLYILLTILWVDHRACLYFSPILHYLLVKPFILISQIFMGYMNTWRFCIFLYYYMTNHICCNNRNQGILKLSKMYSSYVVTKFSNLVNHEHMKDQLNVSKYIYINHTKVQYKLGWNWIELRIDLIIKLLGLQI